MSPHPDALAQALQDSPVQVDRAEGASPVLLLCEHASAWIPPTFAHLGLAEADRQRHIAWDPGALALARRLSERLDAPLVHARYSRLLLDLNRAPDATDSIVEASEGTAVPGNLQLDPAHRLLRAQRIYEPFHDAVAALLDRRQAAGQPAVLLSVHSFTPRYHGVARPWHAGVIHRHDRALGEDLLASLRAEPDLCIGDNQPYGPHEGAFHSMQRHAEARGLRGAMFEVRQDLLEDEHGLELWAGRLQRAIALALPA